MSVDDFLAVLKYKDAPSPALFEIYMALARMIVNDKELYSNIASSLPSDLHFAYRLDPTSRSESEVAQAIDSSDFDIKYNGIKLVDRRLKVNISELKYSLDIFIYDKL